VTDISPIIREIKRRRLALGLTQTAVAKAAGISKTAVCEIEGGNHKPNLDTLIGLARGVGMSLSLELDPQRHQPHQVCRSCNQPWPCTASGGQP
jgi:transcriptional regulator with XRE-family HTH domain